MKDIIFNQKLTENEIKKFCDKNNLTLIMKIFKENKTTLKVI